MLSVVEKTRLCVSQNTDAKKKSLLGQFLTPERIATFMAGLFPDSYEPCRLLDAGAGIGSLSAAFLERWHSGALNFKSVELDAYEIDKTLHPHLVQTLGKYRDNSNLFINIIENDFVLAATDSISNGLFSQKLEFYTHAILNPPYKKINSRSAHRLALRGAGIETVNLYSAFVALAVALAVPGGQIVAIIPRSFCNGPYYRPFRNFVFQRAVIRHMHLFESRNKAFKDDDVLQENIIIRLERAGQQGPIMVSTSTDDSFSDFEIHEHQFDQIVLPGDSEQFIHVPTIPEQSLKRCSVIRHSLSDIGINVSTGPVIDFRLQEHLRNMPEPGTVPLLYPGHFSSSGTIWPQPEIKKPNAIQRNSETEKWLYPNGFYCVVRRFSSKEERHRVVAGVVDPHLFDGMAVLGFENHLNVFHVNRSSLPEALAHGLAMFLNSTIVDENFRRFSGHTQVNATDLKQMKYPSRANLIELGEWAMKQAELTQLLIDEKLETLIE
ncbi:MAG TPA: Eco57I restriction-modification methylase domain-containing protein [Candidatus Rifleibacterium sp.]|nr:Eco57I restriction-modification methylase domain-containing protein [Candidatus Rifleibacterium sp.]HPT44615.1 Eco57I restriction-modification methylase domain-containing protein [Candidatus Rifleibacterium sp.]